MIFDILLVRMGTDTIIYLHYRTAATQRHQNDIHFPST